MTILCPHCAHEIDITDKDTGARLYHPSCGGWLLIGRRADGAKYGVKIEPPATYPRGRRG